jgi:hypothetical protein
MAPAERTAQEWYREAARCYGEAHQGCAWCGGRNLVYRTLRQPLIEYHCGGCDFYVAAEEFEARYFMTPGHVRRGKSAPQTMHEVEWSGSGLLANE